MQITVSPSIPALIIGTSIRLLNFANRQTRYVGQLPIGHLVLASAVPGLNTAVRLQHSHTARLMGL